MDERYLTLPIVELDAMMRDRGMIAFSDILDGQQPLDAFKVNLGVTTPARFDALMRSIERQMGMILSGRKDAAADDARSDGTGGVTTGWLRGKRRAAIEIIDHLHASRTIDDCDAVMLHWLRQRQEETLRLKLAHSDNPLNDTTPEADAAAGAFSVFHEAVLNWRRVMDLDRVAASLVEAAGRRAVVDGRPERPPEKLIAAARALIGRKRDDSALDEALDKIQTADISTTEGRAALRAWFHERSAEVKAAAADPPPTGGFQQAMARLKREVSMSTWKDPDPASEAPPSPEPD